MAGVWIRAGLVSVVNGQSKITGAGTTWASGTVRPNKGHTFWGPDGKAYEVDHVTSDTELWIVEAYSGATASGQAYKVDITRTDTVPAFSRQLSAQLAQYQGIFDGYQTVVTGTGDVVLTAPDGQTITVPALSNMLSKSGNLAGLADKAAARANLGAYKQGDASGINLNAVIDTGEFHVTGNETNWPWQGIGGHLYVHDLAHGNYATQIAVSGGDGQIATRTMSPGGVWTAWVEVMRKTGDQYMAGTLTNRAGRINIEGDRFTALRLLNAYTDANLRQKLIEFGDDGSVLIVTRGVDDITRGIIVLPPNVSGTVFTSGNPPTANNVGAVPLFDQLESRHLNDIQVPGEYKVAGTQGGWPFSGSGGLLSVRALAGGTYLEQVARSSSFNTVKTRLLVAGIWRDWVDNWNGENFPVTSGAWTPYFDNGSVTVTHASWRKIGDMCTIKCHVNLTNFTGTDYLLYMHGLPFSSSGGFSVASMYASSLLSGLPVAAERSMDVIGLVTGNSVEFYSKTTDGGMQAVPQSSVRPQTNGTVVLIISGTYQTA